MHTVDLLNQALELAQRLGYTVRQEWLGGSVGGGCLLKGRRLMFLDLALGPADQLDQVLAALRREQLPPDLAMSPALRAVLGLRKIA